MDASSAKRRVPCTTAAAPADEAMLLPLSSSSLPPSHYFQTCPHLLTNSPNQRQPKALTTSASLNDYPRRQSLKSYCATTSENNSEVEVEFSNSNRSTSSPQLMSVKTARSKVYRRASLKSLTNLPVNSPAQSKVMRISNNGKTEKRLLFSSKNNNTITNNNKENIVCNPLSSPYPYSTPCQKINSENSDKLAHDSSVNHRDEGSNDNNSKQPKSSKSSCSSFLPILSLIPNTVISFQYPSPKMKFSWWRNKIS